MNWVREDRTDSGKHPNTSVGSELTQWRKGGAGNTETGPLPAQSSILDGDLACYKLNAASCRPLDGGVRVEYDPKENFLETSYMYVRHSKLGWADVLTSKELLKKSAIPHTCVTVNPRRVLIFFEKSQFSFFIDFSIGKFFEKNVGRRKSSRNFHFHWLFHRKIFRKKCWSIFFSPKFSFSLTFP